MPDYAPRGRRALLPALGFRDYRRWFVGSVITTVGQAISATSLQWIVLERTGKAIYPALLVVCFQIPMALCLLPAGLLSDRCDKRKILLLTRIGLMGLTLALAALNWLDALTVLLILLISVARGTLTGLANPAGQTILSDMVGRALLPSALALNFAVGSGGAIVGALAGGWLLDRVGLTACLLLDAASMLGLLVALAIISPTPRRPAPARSPLHDLRLGVVFALRRPSVYTNLAMLGVLSMFVLGQRGALVPVFARQVFGGGPQMLGYLNAASALGSTLGSLAVAAYCRVRHQGRWMFGGGLFAAGALALFAVSPDPLTAGLGSMLIGAAWFVFASPSNSAVQLAGGNRLQGRVLSLHILVCTGLTPIGGLVYGLMADRLSPASALGAQLGPRLAPAIGAAIVLLAALTLGWRMRRFDRQDDDHA